MGGLQHTSQDPSEDSTKDAKDEKSELEFSEDEVSLVARMFSLVGKRWGLIAGRIPGRSAEEIKKYWTSKYSISSSER
ncbi:transcription factor CPC-like [Tripterygium wilfordii]|uniref:transcription factor CPC-like n=1 Tax=Tripterygium wilfordii TaxID=458696 RepID=UPI0018F85BB9|nr:transcription factor CPC-like [Tripterygium wilfordii]